MDAVEIQAKVTIAAALIVSHAVELPAIPARGTGRATKQAYGFAI